MRNLKVEIKKYGIVIAWLLMGILVVGHFVIGCTTVTTFSTAGLTASLTHWGFDFATGTRTAEAGVYDGEIINWNPDGVTTTVEGTTYASYGNYLWWRVVPPLPYQKHLGQVALNTITSIPVTWDSRTSIWPLLAGHAYVVKCSPEGYAKFYVTSVGTGGTTNWPAEVEYQYTSGTTF